MEKNDKKEKRETKKKINREKLVEKQKEASVVRRIVFVCLMIILLAISGGAYAAYNYVVSAIGPVDEEDDTIVEVSIPIGSTSTSIGNILEENGVISSADIFRLYVRFTNESGFQAGDYELTKAMPMDQIIDELKQGAVYLDYNLTFTIPEGRWLEEAIQIIVEETNLEEEDLVETLNDEEYLQELIDRYAMLEDVILDDEIRWPLEGYLFPARYDFVEEEVEAEQVIQTMLDRTAAILTANGAGESEYTYHEILTMASIVEGEARNDEEREKIAGVIFNRLTANMRLEMDPTVGYAHGERFSRTLNEHLEIRSPYNTYHVHGIPIGPINSPGEASIRAVLNPMVHDYLFFYHAPSGNVYFSEDFEEHNRAIQQYR
ncbi:MULTISPECIES: endolytic transglycosylase MltG [Bacillaceae]|uniref:Endolytic murein transglycosylase n=1 Tax=Evansella alkalicola TaxID=745819 RepID=A0ABS6JQ87_9BACI|nr:MULTISPECIES: endolytic transglycosylase MltG [Bacillaceae]MBU9720663.1 endolytic transglycosylase MltG [Bacillus alkalicola]